MQEATDILTVMGPDLWASSGESLIDDFYDSLTALLRLYQFRNRNQIKMSGVTASQAYVLDSIARLGPSWISRIAAELHLDKSTASRLVDSLEKSGMVDRKPDPENHRAAVVHLTAAGRTKHEQMTRLIKAEYQSILADVPSDAVARMISVLERIRMVAGRRMQESRATSSEESAS